MPMGRMMCQALKRRPNGPSTVFTFWRKKLKYLKKNRKPRLVTMLKARRRRRR
jgi:hypothetical protein